MFALIAGRLNTLELCAPEIEGLTGAESYRIEFTKCGEQKRVLQIATIPVKCNDCLKFTLTVGCDQEVDLSTGLWQFQLYADDNIVYVGQVHVNKIVKSLNEYECKT